LQRIAALSHYSPDIAFEGDAFVPLQCVEQAKVARAAVGHAAPQM